MSDLLSIWVNDEVRLSLPITNACADFANGYRLGELLYRLDMMSDGEFEAVFKNDSTSSSVVANFNKLSVVLNGVGIKFENKTAVQILNKHKTAALNVVYQIKMVHSKMQKRVRSNEIFGRMKDMPLKSKTQVLGMSVHSTKARYDTLERERLRQRLIATSHMGAKEQMMNLHLSKYQDKMESNTDQARKVDEHAENERRERLNKHRAERIEQLYNARAFREAWDKEGEEKWAESRRVQQARVQNEKEFVLKTLEKKETFRSTLKLKSQYEMEKGVDEFEKNLERIGVEQLKSGASNQNEVEEDMYGSAMNNMTAVEHMEYLRNKIPTAEDASKRASQHLQKISSKAKSNALARKEREQRRRRVLVEQNRESEEAEKEREHTLLMKKLLRSSESEGRLVDQLWRDRQYKAIIEENQSYAEQQIRDERRERYESSLANDMSHFESDKRMNEELIDLSLERLEGVRQAKAQAKRVKNEKYCRSVVHRLVDLSVKAAHYRDLTDQELIPPATWKVWTELFVSDLSLLPTPQEEKEAAEEKEAEENVVNLQVDTNNEETPVEKEETLKDMVQTKDGFEIDRAVSNSMKYIGDISAANTEFVDDSMFDCYLQNECEWNVDIPFFVEAVPPQPSSPTHHESETKTQGGSVHSRRGHKQSSGPLGSPSHKRGSNVKKLSAPIVPNTPTSVQENDIPVTNIPSNVTNEDAGNASSPERSPRVTIDDNKQHPVTTTASDVPTSNQLMGSVIQKIFSIASGEEKPPIIPDVPETPIGIVVIGKDFSGRNVQATHLSKKHQLKMLTLESIIEEALDSVQQSSLSSTAKMDVMSKSGNIKTGKKLDKKDQTIQQQLGYQMKKLMARGKTVSDELYVSLVVDAIKRVQEASNVSPFDQDNSETPVVEKVDDNYSEDEDVQPEIKYAGWVLAGFPETVKQAQLLSKELSGFEVPKPKKAGPPKVTKDKKSKVKSRIAPPPNAPVNEEPYPSSIDLVIELDCDNETLVRRALGRRLDPVTELHYHIDSNPPDLDQAVKERLVSLPNSEDIEAKLPERFSAYEDEAVEMKSWFDLFGNFHRVAAINKVDKVADDIYAIVRQLMDKQAAAKAQIAENAALLRRQQEQQQLEEAKRQSDILNAEYVEPSKTPKSLSKSETKRISGNDENTTKSENSTEAEVVPPANVKDLSNFEGFLDVELAGILSERWANIETSFTTHMKETFQSLRKERLKNVEHFAALRKNFFRLLRRPDSKNLAIAQFQTDYNNVHPDLRMDSQAKEEFHQRADELGDKLWDLIEKRREENEGQLREIEEDGWVENESSLYVLLYASLMQNEVERYFNSIKIAQDYFSVLKAQVIFEDDEPTSYTLPVLNKAPGRKVDVRRKKDTSKKKGDKGRGSKKIEDNYNPAESLLECKTMIDEWILTPGEVVDQMNELVSDRREKKKGNANLKNKRKEMKKTSKKVTEISSATAKRYLNQNIDEQLAEAQLSHIIEVENQILKSRIERIYRNGYNEVHQLRHYAENVLQPKLDNWLGLRLKGESSSVETLIYIIKTAIEREKPLFHRLRLEGEDVYIDEDVIAHPIPVMPTSSNLNNLFDPNYANRFTAEQLYTVGSNARSAARLESGDCITVKNLKLLLLRIGGAMSDGNEIQHTIPLRWSRFTPQQMNKIVCAFDTKQSNFVDWRHFIISLSLPLPISTPSISQLEVMKKACIDLDADNDGKLTQDEFFKLMFWFEDSLSDLPTKTVSTGLQTKGNESVSTLKQVYFKLFAVQQPDDFTSSLPSELRTILEEKRNDSTIQGIVTNLLPFDELLVYFCFNDSMMTGIEKLNRLFPEEDRSELLCRFVERAQNSHDHIFTRKDIDSLTLFD